MMSRPVRRLIQRSGWWLPLLLIATLVAAQWGKQAGLVALGRKVPAVPWIVLGMLFLMPLGLAFWTGMVTYLINCVRPNGRSIPWREVVSLYLLASLTHVIFTGASLTWMWATGSPIPVRLIRIPNGSVVVQVLSLLVTLDAVIATLAFFVLTLWYVRWFEPQSRSSRLVAAEGRAIA